MQQSHRFPFFFLYVLAEPRLAEVASDRCIAFIYLHYAEFPFNQLSGCRSGRFTAFQFTPSRPIPIEYHTVLTISCCHPVEETLFASLSFAEDVEAPVTPQPKLLVDASDLALASKYSRYSFGQLDL